jgi:hypothetical protein
MNAKNRKIRTDALEGHFDADVTTNFARDLEFISQEMFKIDYAENRSRMLIPVSHEIPEGTKTYTYREWDRSGIAKVIADYASDLPMADAFGKEYTSQIRPFGIGFGYTFQELRAAKLTGRPIDSMRAEAAREGFESYVDLVGAVGDSAWSLLGLLNQPNVPSYVIPNGAGASPLWSLKTSDEIVADINGIATTTFKTTKQRESPKTLLLPTSLYTLIANKRMGSNTDTTILQWVLQNGRFYKEIDTWTRLDGAGAGGSDRILSYTRDPSKVRLQIAMEQQVYSPQIKNLKVMVPTEGEIGGVVVYKPYSMIYADGAA